MYNVRRYLTAEERSGCMQLGAMLKLAQYGVTPREFCKQAAGDGTTAFAAPYAAMRAIAGLALITGIPIGIAAHIVGNRVTGTRQHEQELQEKIKYYRNATGALGTGLGNEAATEM